MLYVMHSTNRCFIICFNNKDANPMFIREKTEQIEHIALRAVVICYLQLCYHIF